MIEPLRGGPAVPIRPGDSEGSRSASQTERERSVEVEEHQANVARMRAIGLMGAILWPACAALDWVAARFVEPGILGSILAIRAVFSVMLVGIVIRLYAKPTPGPRLLRGIAAITFVGASVDLAVMCTQYGGIASPYAHGLSCILVGGGIALPDHWRRSVPLFGATALAWPVTLLSSAAWSPRVAAQLRDPAALTVFAQNVTLQLVTLLLLVVGGHAYWRVRRQVFEARLVGRYRLRRRLAKGGMGDVWRAYHPTLRRDVAIKILRAHDSDAAAIERFEREVEATAELAHPNTVRVLDFGVTDDGLWFYTMELLEGETLTKLVKRENGLPVARAVYLVHQAVRALAEAHGRGIVHRDVKPDNLFVTALGGESDFVKVIDFGIAKAQVDGRGTSLTTGGAVLGTPLFMAPEQGEGRGVDARSDVYALGAVLYFALTGTPPFAGSSAVAVLSAHLHTPLEPPSKRIGRPIPEDVEAIVARAMAKDPDDRYASAVELDEALAACSAAGQWKPARRVGGPPPRPEAAVRDDEGAALAETEEISLSKTVNERAPKD